MATLIHVENYDSFDLSDYVSLTDVALRKSLEVETGLYIAESAKVIKRALDAGHEPRSVLLQEQWLPEMQDILSTYDCPIYLANSDLVEQITGFNIHRGAIASMKRPPLPEFQDIIAKASLVVVLENIVDHTNVGAIFRAAAGMGADAVLVSAECADPLYRRAVRVSMGSVLQVPWTRMPDWDQSKKLLSDSGFHLAALALSDEAITLKDFALNRPEKVAIVLGAEGDGLTRKAISVADSIVKIPMSAGVDSLNVASASAVALYALTN